MKNLPGILPPWSAKAALKDARPCDLRGCGDIGGALVQFGDHLPVKDSISARRIVVKMVQAGMDRVLLGGGHVLAEGGGAEPATADMLLPVEWEWIAKTPAPGAVYAGDKGPSIGLKVWALKITGVSA